MLALSDEEEQDLMVTSLQELKKEFGKKFEEQEKKFEEQEKKLSYLLHTRKLSKQGQAKKTNMITSHNIEDDDLSFGSEGHDTEANESIELLRKEQKESFFILENHFQTLRDRVEADQSSASSMHSWWRPAAVIAGVVQNQNDASSDAVTQDSDINDDLLYKIPSDTFTLMTFYSVRSKAWALCIGSYLMQMFLVILILLIQTSQSDNSTPFNVPFKVDSTVRIGQFTVIPLSLLHQDDVLSSLQTLFAFWNCDCTAFQELFKDHADPPSPPASQKGSSSRDYRFYALYIFLPNLLKFAQGALVLVASTVIIVQGDDLLRLLKGFTALFFVSEVDNVIFKVTNAGYFGRPLALQAQATIGKVIDDKKKWSMNLRSIVMITIGSLMVAALSFVMRGQLSGNFFAQQYPDCFVTDAVAAISKMKNGICDGGELNTLGCAFDGGDCINHNLAFPGCNVDDPEVLLGNGVCDGGAYNTPECKYDNGDCIIANYTDCHSFNDIELFGDGVCHLEFNTAPCGNDKGDCDLINSYPNCDIPDPDQLGDETCNTTSPYNSILCGFDGGDCVDDVDKNNDEDMNRCKYQDYPNPFGIIELLGNGKCNAVNNNQACSWDGKDCLEFNAKYPACGGRYKDIDPERVGDGTCDNFGGYNSLECGNDGSDCSDFNLQYPECEGENPDVIGDGNCDPEYNNAECGFDGFDCLDVDCTIDTGSLCTKYKERFPDCPLIDPRNMGEDHYYGGPNNDRCDEELNVEACNFDGGDCASLDCSTVSISTWCDDLLSKYPTCALDKKNAYRLGNFRCDSEFNTEKCGWDMGDCDVTNYPDCRMNFPVSIGNGRCDGGAYNTAECGFDGGDCEEFNKYPNCDVVYPFKIGDGRCDDYPPYNTAECGFDGGDCL